MVVKKEFRHIKKAQSALEFLTTYGWAFLVILIMIGTLAYFGILSPGKILPNRCNFGTEFQCIDYQIATTGAGAPTSPWFKLKLKNNVGETISVSAISITKEDGTTLGCPAANSPGGASGLPIVMPVTMAAASITEFGWGACPIATTGWTAGGKSKVLVSVTYNTLSGGAGYNKIVGGETYTTII